MKFNQSKIFVFLEKVYYLIIINTMILLGSVFFITFLNSISAGLYSLQALINYDDYNITKNYWKKFKEISYKGIYSNIIVYFWFGMLYTLLPLVKAQHISGLIIFYFILIELIIFTVGLIKVFSSRKIGSVFQNSKEAILIGHFELPSLISFFISVFSSLLILYKIRLLIPLFIVAPIYMITILNNRFNQTRSLK